MLTTISTSVNSKRCGVSASRSFGPISGSSLISVKVRSITSRNSCGDLNAVIGAAGVYGQEPLDRADPPEPDDRAGRACAVAGGPRKGSVPRADAAFGAEDVQPQPRP